MPEAETASIRPYRPEDLEALYRVCLETGAAGEDATHLHEDDPLALGHLYVGPYVSLEPELAYVLEDEHGVCGYVLGTLDTAAFHERYLRDWLPPLQERLPHPRGDPQSWTPTQRLYHQLHHPEPAVPPEILASYPSHLHIDLLPRAQKRGHGRRLLETLLAALAEHGSAGVFLGMDPLNTGAQGFYAHLGFRGLRREQFVVLMARALP